MCNVRISSTRPLYTCTIFLCFPFSFSCSHRLRRCYLVILLKNKDHKLSIKSLLLKLLFAVYNVFESGHEFRSEEHKIGIVCSQKC